MPELFDGTEDAESSNPNPAIEPPANPTQQPRPPQLTNISAWASLGAGLLAATVFFWLVFPLTLLIAAVGVPITPPAGAVELYLQAGAVLAIATVAFEIVRRWVL